MVDEITPEQYESIRTGQPISPSQFKELPKEQRREIIEKHKDKLNDYGLEVKEKSNSKLWWVLIIILAIGVSGFLYLTYEGKFQSLLNSSNICEPQVCDLKCSEIPDCKPTLNCNVTFPNNLNINIINSS